MSSRHENLHQQARIEMQAHPPASPVANSSSSTATATAATTVASSASFDWNRATTARTSIPSSGLTPSLGRNTSDEMTDVGSDNTPHVREMDPAVERQRLAKLLNKRITDLIEASDNEVAHEVENRLWPPISMLTPPDVLTGSLQLLQFLVT
jgi:hypothetical protein